MSNTMYLVCVHHPDRVHSFRLGSRGTCTRYVTGARIGQKLDDWLELHATCGGGQDHFTLAFDLTKDHDLPIPAPVANAVHGVLRVANDCNAMPMDAGDVT
jgi:hypothetical protein